MRRVALGVIAAVFAGGAPLMAVTTASAAPSTNIFQCLAFGGHPVEAGGSRICSGGTFDGQYIEG